MEVGGKRGSQNPTLLGGVNGPASSLSSTTGQDNTGF
jgi:hypothetical protein